LSSTLAWIQQGYAVNSKSVVQRARHSMVQNHIEARGISDAKVLAAMRLVPREKFIEPEFKAKAYQDNPLPIGAGQTISQPYIVALMSEALLLKGFETVLEIGTGSGYAAAVLSLLCHQVYTVECIDSLAQTAGKTLQTLDYTNIDVICADGTLGWPDKAPYDAVVVTAGGPKVPESLKQQLVIGGRLVMPTGPRHQQSLLRVTRTSENEYRSENLATVCFVPLTGVQGW